MSSAAILRSDMCSPVAISFAVATRSVLSLASRSRYGASGRRQAGGLMGMAGWWRRTRDRPRSAFAGGLGRRVQVKVRRRGDDRRSRASVCGRDALEP